MFRLMLSARRKFVLILQLVICLACLSLGGLYLGDFLFSTCKPKTRCTTLNRLDAITALTASDAWAVGWASGLGSGPLIEHWNGLFWYVVPAPGKGDASSLEGLAARSAQDIWAVGEFYQRTGYETLIEHWNGLFWSVVPSPNGPGDNGLESVAVGSATDVWAVGTTILCPEPIGPALPQQGNILAREPPANRVDPMCTGSSYPPPQSLIEHWDGHAWSMVSSPNFDTTAAGLSNVVAFGKDDVWATGTTFYRDSTHSSIKVLIEHWGGSAWSLVPNVEQGLESEPELFEPDLLLFLSSSDIWGTYDYPIMEHCNGSSWSCDLCSTI